VAVGGIPKVGNRGVGSGGISSNAGLGTQLLIRMNINPITKLIGRPFVYNLRINLFPESIPYPKSSIDSTPRLYLMKRTSKTRTALSFGEHNRQYPVYLWMPVYNV
jgi:hypothetical protein